jgi:hypothetical protein
MPNSSAKISNTPALTNILAHKKPPAKMHSRLLAKLTTRWRYGSGYCISLGLFR